jgi:hypothetical protein
MKFMFQTNDKGWSRIALETDDSTVIFGDWVTDYCSLAKLTYDGQNYIAGDDAEATYGILPHARIIYQLQALPTIVEDVMCPVPDKND